MATLGLWNRLSVLFFTRNRQTCLLPLWNQKFINCGISYFSFNFFFQPFYFSSFYSTSPPIEPPTLILMFFSSSCNLCSLVGTFGRECCSSDIVLSSLDNTHSLLKSTYLFLGHWAHPIVTNVVCQSKHSLPFNWPPQHTLCLLTVFTDFRQNMSLVDIKYR